MLDVGPGEVQSVPIDGMVVSDTLEWNWSTSAADLSVALVWVDSSAGVHRVNATSPEYSRFQAPANFAAARIEWANGGSANATVMWSYACVADFWSQPGLIAAACIPLILLGGALAAGRVVDGRAKARQRDEGR
jgi:predicted NAD/FAD-dependent oxidoreductase